MSSDEPNVSVGVIGCGYWGRNLVRNFNDLGALRTVCDTEPAGRRLASEIAPSIDIVEDLDRVLDSDVAAVVVSSPAATHYSIASRALESGKDVFVEKPLSLTYSEGSELVRLAAERHRILMVGHVLEYHPAIKALHSMVEGGELGDLYYIYSNRVSLGKVRREENILWSFAPHDVAVILRLVGSLPLQVVACGGTYIQPDVADVTLTNMFFDGGVGAHIHVSWLHPFKEQRLVVIGSRRMASFDDVTKQLVLYDQRVEIKAGEPAPIRGDGQEISFDGEEPLRLECQAFLDAIRTRVPPVTDGDSGLRVLRVLEAAQRSLKARGEPVSLAAEMLA